jgi:AraC-like DNA-binding protein
MGNRSIGSAEIPIPATTRITAYVAIPELLREFGVATADVLADCQLATDFFDDREQRVTFLELERLLLACERYTRCDHFGFLLGQRATLAHMGLAGEVALCQPTAGDGLRSFVAHFSMHNAAATATLIDAGSYVRLVYAIAEHGLTDTRHLQLGSVTTAFNILQVLFGPAWLPVGVTFASRPVANPHLLRRYFRAPIEFDSSESAVLFARHWLDEPLPPIDPSTRRRVFAEIRELRGKLLADFPSTVRRILRKQILLGRFSMDDIAAQLSMHRRTLDRHLQRHGVRYGELLESVREDAARQLLCDTRMPIQRIAESMHFSSAANFATAFRRRSGITPSEYRRQAAAG